ncbi:MAG: diacylglycerol kinase [Actinomycetia bacterium]|nr:diacylglycerol kinase [Actinomycetes bacterium]
MKTRSLLDSFNYAIEGIIYTLKTQRNMKIHFLVGIFVMIISLFFRISSMEMILIIFAVTFVLFAELVNTAVESTIDVTTTTHDPLAKIAKDASAGAVLIASLNAIFIGYLIFFERMNPFTLKILERISNSPSHITFITLILVVFIVVIFKSLRGEVGYLRGGWPSGHSAVAGALFTSIAFLSQNIFVPTLSFFLALLVFQSRIEQKVHDWLDVLSGALIGIVITTVLFQLFYFT